MKITGFTACFLFAGIFSLFAEVHTELSTILPENIAKSLSEKGSLQNSSYRKEGSRLQLAPDVPLVRNEKNIPQVPAEPFFTENLYLYKKNAADAGDAGKDTEKISVILRSISRLEGIQYYSNSRKKMRTLYETSYVVESEKNRKRIPDPITGSADGVSLVALQKDLTFGENLYRYEYRQDASSVAFFSSNIESMSYSFFKLIEPKNLHISLVVFDMGDSLLVYGLTCADFPAVPGLEGKLTSSFSTRADAIYKWFISEYEK